MIKISAEHAERDPFIDVPSLHASPPVSNPLPPAVFLFDVLTY